MAVVTLVDYTQDAELKIGKYAAFCYDSDTSDEACLRRASSCCKRGHLATLRFAQAVFRIEGISRACSHQLVRSKHLDYLQESQRYVNQENVALIDPFVYGTEVDSIFCDAVTQAKQAYKKLIEKGVKKEDARMVLPNATATRLYVVGNFQAWRDFIRLRTDKAAQWEIREVALEIQRQLAGIAPNIFGEVNA